ncbi:MAG: 2-C-methyl-D-erythritol 4-phosphate cytidylyltransferase [Gammaproteobacteria bacterium]|jgi:2-C-methyl-D-erythritol 4-phosphate cytidylyltransferase|nr:2-C-methyl-D-erythritol 4-phosphate cytidylyltransferase [Gammaproteobacteria bacterium]MBT3488397.1 2-C-methyl-D-erythritol 4-phosphate cytidylyltransferase [Gammaproteobacteria bacterium]MBT3719630.1 2-C-methyl-D-erythritol 4-phosphate cytidylyltransferase [Gammaproteobacteria bacterium]MBT3845050.1 2-C-methyl-D-erythritol 4-phosphate cytidylyltransferase [Gammaproteobacteria bacterium]MBT3892389.1 2-C-methyl-D-erythritol 4-phosphate cytidylyltransferase [Gammaproteobacteria bacterium]
MIWAVVPAAGSGLRMRADRPKQYLPLAGKTVIQHSIERLLSNQNIRGVVVAVAAEDGWWPHLQWSAGDRIHRVEGGAERSDSVCNALQWLSGTADDQDWVLVHDAARPCLRAADLQSLIESLQEDAVGGILAAPVSDTIKRADAKQKIAETVDRSVLWRALTPQMFRLGVLRAALEQIKADGVAVTDDAEAVEYLKLQPCLIEGAVTNIKVTHPGDLLLAEEIILRELEER